MITKYQSVANKNVVVEVQNAEAEYRLGEMKRKAVVYTREGKWYVRLSEEFFLKFAPLKSTTQV